MTQGNTWKSPYAIAAILILLFIVGGHVLLYLKPGPLPTKIATQLGHMEEAGKRVQFLVGRAKAENTPETLTKVRAEYEDLEASLNQTLQHVYDGIGLNAIDTADLESTLPMLEKREAALHEHLVPLSKQIVKAGFDLEFIWKFFETGVMAYRDYFKARGEMEQVAKDMLRRMRWPDWDEVPKRSLLDN
ncbi:MAG TPA: hypothetical protein VFF58_00015 [Candidatus Nitrosotalea sp.]|nr:hypothetical protein [Candidatus Nitrosotalea sp.]